MGIFKKVAGSIIDVRVDKWMSFEHVKETFTRTKILLLDLVIPQKATRAETYEQALERLGLTDEDVAQRRKEFTRLFYFFVTMSVLIASYASYLLYRHHTAVAILSLCIALYALSQAFRFHFWLFQIKHKKLGCSLREWFCANTAEEQQAKHSHQKTNPKLKDKNIGK